MKCILYKVIVIFTLLITFRSTTAAQSNFFNADCGNNVNGGSFCSSSSSTENVNVSGLPTLGVNNFGLVEVFIDFNTIGSSFNSQFVLVAPNDEEYMLASTFSSSFPDWQGGSAGISFVPCLTYSSTTQAGPSINLETFQPIDDYSQVNDDMINPNGTWQIKSCIPISDDVPFDIFCIRLVFDNICTEALNVGTVNPVCAGEETVILFDINPGICPGIWASVDNINYQSFSGLENNQLLTNNTDASTLYIEDSQPGTEQNSNCLPTETPLFIAPTDFTPPVIDCPSGFDVFFETNCTASFNLTDPNLTDNCTEVSGTVSWTDPDGMTTGPFSIVPGEEYAYNWASTAGIFTFEWIATDAVGNITDCQTIINVKDNTPPEFIESEINIVGECGVDDYNSLYTAAVASLDVIEACDMEVFIFPLVTGDEEVICGNSIEYTSIYQTGNDNGPFNDIYSQNFATITIEMIDTQAPVIVGMNQNDVTISCNESLPSIPQIGVDVFADDTCQGDVTSDMTLSGSSALGDCLAGQPIEVYTYVYTATDQCGNWMSKSFSITIMNDVAPEFDAPFDNGNITLNITCGIDDLDATIAANVPTASGCSGPAAISIFSESEGSGPCNQVGGSNPSSNYTVVYQAEDDCGNTALVSITIDFHDLTPPVINGVPANVTVGCNDTPPNLPSVTAVDACAGDLTSMISYEQIDIIGTCDINDNSVIEQHTWTVSDFCGNETSVTWEVYLLNDEQVTLGPNITACAGEDVFLTPSGNWAEYIWQDFSTTSSYLVVEPGTYSVTVTGFGGCCSVDELTVTYQDFPSATAVGGTLDCSGQGVTLMGSSTSSGVTYTWTGPGGYSSTEQNPTVTQAGTYILSVITTAGCITTADAVVQTDTDVPDISTTGGTITCNISEVTISGSSSTPGVTYAWTGPSGYASTEQNPMVSAAGDYNLVISAPNGCIAEGLAVVVDDTTIPTAVATGGIIDCANNQVTLMGSSSDSGADYTWEGPNGYTSTEQNPTISESGTYTLTTSSNNGCTNTDITTVSENLDIPNLTADGGTIDCNNSVVELSATSTTTGVDFQWTGPNGYSSTDPNPEVDFAGEYIIIVEASNGCTEMMTVIVNENLTAPTVTIETDELNCIQSFVTLMPEATQGVTFAWTGPAGYTSNDENPEISEAGDYAIVVTGTNGCTATASVTITEDTTEPQITVADGTIDCTNPVIALSLMTTTGGVTFEWTGPDNFSSDIQNPEIDEAGDYIVTSTGSNGCFVQNTVSISEDITIPNVSAVGGEINCDANTVQIMGSSTTADVTFSWTGPNDFISSTQSPNVGSPGTYVLTITGANGCTIAESIEVTADEDLPNITAAGGELDCNTSEITLMGSSTTSGVTYSWSGPENFESTEQNPTITTEGIYTLSVASTNGCVSETEVTVTLDDSKPTVIALGGVISCSVSSISLVGNSNDIVTYSWTGPGGFSSTDQNPEVTTPGEYILTVTGENGCTNFVTVEVAVDENLPVASIGTPSIDCDNNAVTITVEATEDYTYEWAYDGSIISANESITISEAGNYAVVVTANNGCTVTLSYALMEDFAELTADISTTDATSSTGGTAEIIISNPDAVLSILWDNGQTGSIATDLMAGMHTVTVTNFLGCIYTFTFEVLMSTAVSEIEVLEEFVVYPTIVQDYITVEARLSAFHEYSIQINDVQGRQIMKENYKSSSIINERISTNDLTSGVYFISFSIGKKIKTTKFVKM